MRAPVVVFLLAACATPPPPPPPPPPVGGFPFRHSVDLAEVGCTEFYSADPLVAADRERRYNRPGDNRYAFSKNDPCDRASAWAVCELTLKDRAIVSYLYKEANKRQTSYHCRQTHGKFTELR